MDFEGVGLKDSIHDQEDGHDYSKECFFLVCITNSYMKSSRNATNVMYSEHYSSVEKKKTTE